MHDADVRLILIVHFIKNKIVATKYSKTAWYNTAQTHVKYIHHLSLGTCIVVLSS